MPEYQALSCYARCLLDEIAYQYRGHNNGQLLAGSNYLSPRGWGSNDTITKALRELLDTNFVHKTVQGGLPNKASWFALTWRTIDPHPGYDYGAVETFRRRHLLPKAVLIPVDGAGKKAVPAPPHGAKAQSVAPPDGARKNAILTPPHGAKAHPIAPPHGAIEGVSAGALAPPHGEHICKYHTVSVESPDTTTSSSTAAVPCQAQQDAVKPLQAVQPAAGDRVHGADDEQKKIGSPKISGGADVVADPATDGATDGLQKFRPRGWWTPDRIAELRAFRAAHWGCGRNLGLVTPRDPGASDIQQG
jgi:hypothetical protein